ncbi:putative pathogenesis-related protein [Pseudocercospora fuligena]|uniref:Putative pathogenesis-related protein n=1 Tax=Pseudocercospora fuligena TaxID=685502 RepID=A0A8H6VDA5_9PEZI|nr:putative pathogenesis-related protein [Pseudocercospora fuligena]
MRLTFLVAALLSSTLALPTEDDADKQKQGQKKQPKPVVKQVKQVKHAHYAHRQPAGAGSHNAINHGAQRVQVQRHATNNAVQVKQRPAAHQVAQAHQQAAAHHTTNWGTPGYVNDPYQDRVLKHHNYHRQNHLATALVWDQALAYTAQLVAQTCVYQHNMQFDPGAGQNIAAGYGPHEIGIVITDLFYNNEIPMFQNQWYREPDMTYFEQWGHMTQMCWKATTHVGCATQYCPYGLGNVAGGVQPYFTVCNYKNPGNVATEYAQNLSPPQGAAPINGNSF